MGEGPRERGEIPIATRKWARARARAGSSSDFFGPKEKKQKIWPCAMSATRNSNGPKAHLKYLWQRPFKGHSQLFFLKRS